MSRETNAKPDETCMDVVVDLSQVPAQGRSLLLESLIAIDEGMACRYHVRCGTDRLSAAEQGLLLELLSAKDAGLLGELPSLVFPQEQVDRDVTVSATDDATRRAMAKKAWHAANLAVLHAIERHDEFVYLTPASVPLRHGWLAELVAAGRAGELPAYAGARRLRLADGAYRQCGWSSTGWYDGRRLRALPLREAFATRIANPWQPHVDLRRQPGGPGFCLAGEWLSGFDVPMDFLLFALHFRQALGSDDPLAWVAAAEAADTSRIGMHEPESGLVADADADAAVLLQDRSAERSAQQALLRDLYKDTARTALREGDWSLKEADVTLPAGAPRWTLLGGNRVRLGLEELRDRFRGERCFIIGNGPSLNHTDLSRLKGEYTIGLNRIYLNYPNMGFQPSFVCITNPNVIEQFHPEIDALDSIKFLTQASRNRIRNRWNTFFMESRGLHDFHGDLSEQVWCEGCTVTYCAMQVAYHLGFDEVVLVGVDHAFPNAGAAHRLVTADSDDANHFHPDYFGKGIRWQYPDLPASEVSYRVARDVFERDGRRIVDATVDGQLRVFPRVDYAAYLDGEG